MNKKKCILAIVLMVFIYACFLSAAEIHEAAKTGDLAKVKELLAKDPFLVNAKGNNEKEPLHWAAQNGHLKVVELLIERGAAVSGHNIINETPLHYAAGCNYLKVAALLLARGALVDAQSSDGSTALHYATGRKNRAMVKLLLAHGASPNIKTLEGDTVLSYAMFQEDIETFRLLVAKGADVKHRQQNGWTYLHDAGYGNSSQIVQYLIDKGIPVNAKSDTGWTPLHSASLHGNKEIVSLLIRNGADANACSAEGSWPLWLAVQYGHKDVTTLLLQAGARVDEKDKAGQRTPLHLAAAKGYGSIAALLLEKGADSNALDVGGRSPLAFARRYGQSNICTLLQAKGAKEEKGESRSDTPISLRQPLTEGQAIVWYLGHSGWALKSKNHLLIFDYYKSDALPDEASLNSGVANPDEIKDLDVTVFVSHAHGDHYMPQIFAWQKAIPHINYVMGFQPEGQQDYTLLNSSETKKINGLEITAIAANDSGQGFFVVVDGVRIFHPGDHANRQRDFSGPFKKEIDFLADSGRKSDILFVPVCGCGFGDLVSVKRGDYYTIDRLSARFIFPMHANNNEARYQEFAKEARNAGYDNSICQAQFPGDHFFVGEEGVK